MQVTPVAFQHFSAEVSNKSKHAINIFTSNWFHGKNYKSKYWTSAIHGLVKLDTSWLHFNPSTHSITQWGFFLQQGSKCYWLKKQIKHFYIHTLIIHGFILCLLLRGTVILGAVTLHIERERERDREIERERERESYWLSIYTNIINLSYNDSSSLFNCNFKPILMNYCTSSEIASKCSTRQYHKVFIM